MQFKAISIQLFKNSIQRFKFGNIQNFFFFEKQKLPKFNAFFLIFSLFLQLEKLINNFHERGNLLRSNRTRTSCKIKQIRKNYHMQNAYQHANHQLAWTQSRYQSNLGSWRNCTNTSRYSWLSYHLKSLVTLWGYETW